jgi:cell division septation protein DedD
MRHLKSDLSHRIRRRPGALSTRWTKMGLGLGLGALVGWSIGAPGWFHGQPAPSPPSRAVEVALTQPQTALDLAGTRVNGDETHAETGASAGAGKGGGASNGRPETRTQVAALGSHADGLPAYWVQVGAFLDHRNADRLAERVRSEDVEVVSRVIEQSRVLYRVVAEPAGHETETALLERLRAASLTPEPTADGVVVLAPSPLHTAVETARRLQREGLRVRLVRSVTTSPFRVVRVGRFASADEAERRRAELAQRGFPGFVVRE